MAQTDDEATNFLAELSVSKQMAAVIEPFPNDNEESINIPEGLPRYLVGVFDKTRKLAVPVLLGRDTIEGSQRRFKANDSIISIISSAIKTGNTIISTYRAMRTNQSYFESEDELGVKMSLESKFDKLQITPEILSSSMTTFLHSSGEELCHTIPEQDNNNDLMLNHTERMMHGVETETQKILEKFSDDIESAFTVFKDKLSKGQYTLLQEFLKRLNVDDICKESKVSPKKARDTIYKAFKIGGEREAIHEYVNILMLRCKLQTMKRLQYFFNDVERNETRFMAEYCQGPGVWFLDELEEYYMIMKKVFFANEKWNPPVVLIMGKTGTGKSTLSNVLAGNLPNQNYSTCGFPVSESVDACTRETTFGDFCYVGDSNRPVTIIDTPGFDDPTRNQDAEIIANLVEVLKKNFGGIHQILIAVNGTNPRLDGSMKAMIKIFQGMFTEKIWDHIGIVFTKMNMNTFSVRTRERQRKNHDRLFAEDYVKGLKEAFNFKGEKPLDAFFIDSHYNLEYEDETCAFNKAIEDLWDKIMTQEIFPTNYVERVLTEHESLKKEIEKKQIELMNQNRMLRELQKQEEQRIKLEDEEFQETTQGFTFFEIKGFEPKELAELKMISPKGRCYNYQKVVSTIARYNGLYPFNLTKGYDEKDYRLHQQYQNYPVDKGFVPMDRNFVNSEKICTSETGSSLLFCLEIKNRTKYFMIGVDSLDGYSDSLNPFLFYSPSYGLGITLQHFFTFVIPPYTSERLIFSKQSGVLHKLKGFLTFSLGTYPPGPQREEVKKIMIAFQIAGRGKNSFAVGLPNKSLNLLDAKNLLHSKQSLGSYFSKGFHSNLQEKGVKELGQVVRFPPDNKCVPGGFEIKGQCGNGRRCIGFVRIDKTPQRKTPNTPVRSRLDTFTYE